MRCDAGREIQCSRCTQPIKLPGKLAVIATVAPARRKDAAGLALEAAGVVSLFLFFPWGLFAGAVLIWLGWRKCNGWVCDNCGTPVQSRHAERCPGCRSKFGAD